MKKIIEEPIHIMLPNPVGLRKQILETQIDTTKMLRDFLELRTLREHKKKLLNDYNDTFFDIRKLLKKIEKHELPSIKLDEEKHNVAEKTHEKRIDIPKQRVVDPEVERLKRELEDIENKLGSL